MSAVTLDHVSKSFGHVQVVHDVTLAIKPGEFFTFLGPSGCGKTTTLRMIAGFYYPTSGRILFDDKDITYLPANKRNTGMVFQNYALFPHLTVAENVAFGLKVRKVPKKEIEERVERALNQVRLPGLGKRRIEQLSGGQQQRVALARALVIQPSILLLDEPLSNLDAKLREETRWEIKRLQQSLKITAIYVTHDQSEAMAMSDRIAVMDQGRVQQVGTPEEIYNRPANRFVASFIGKTNLLPGTIIAKDAETVTVKLTDEITLFVDAKNRQKDYDPKVGEEVLLSVRPEAMESGEGRGGHNLIRGKVVLAEFTGASIEYEVELAGKTIHATFPSSTRVRKATGDTLMLFIPPENMYIVRGSE